MQSDGNANETVVKSSSKYQQTEETLRTMTERALGTGIERFYSKELGGGMCNAVYLVEADGLKLVLKIAPDPAVITMRHEKDSLLNEVRMLELFAEKIDIPAPKLIALDTSCEVCGAPYFFMSYMEGNPLTTMAEKPPQEAISEIKNEVGMFCKKISSLHAESFGIPVMPETHRDNNCDFMLVLFRMLLQDAADKEIEVPGIRHDELLALIEAERAVLNEAKVPCHIHTDTWDGNLMVKDNKLQGLIDFAAVMYGDPLMNHDFHDFGEPCAAFLEGYGKTEFTHNELIRISLYKIWQRLGMIVERGYRNYEDKNQYAWVLGEFRNEIDHFKKLIQRVA